MNFVGNEYHPPKGSNELFPLALAGVRGYFVPDVSDLKPLSLWEYLLTSVLLCCEDVLLQTGLLHGMARFVHDSYRRIQKAFQKADATVSPPFEGGQSNSDFNGT